LPDLYIFFTDTFSIKFDANVAQGNVAKRVRRCAGMLTIILQQIYFENRFVFDTALTKT